jgi:hypothetical protein
MKYLVLFIAFLCCEFTSHGTPPAQQTTQAPKVYTIHQERRPFVHKPMRRYLKHKKMKKKMIKKRLNHLPPRHK